MTPTLLALDMSSVAIGYVVRNGSVLAHGTVDLNPKADISQRCLAALTQIRVLLEITSIDAVVIESPVARFAKAVIPQARLSGVALAVFASSGYAWLELTPGQGKHALCQHGTATKREMLEAAATHFGYDPTALTFRERKGKWGAFEGDSLVYGEDAADALGLALAAEGKVRVG